MMQTENTKQNEINIAVKQVTDRFGIDIIADHKRFCSAMKDLAPKLSKESKAFFVALSENVGTIYLRDNDAVASGEKSASEVMVRAKSVISEYLNDSKADMITESLAFALGWEIAEVVTSQTDDDYDGGSSTVIEDLMRKAENGSDDACFNIGESFFYGRGGVKQDYVKAVEWYTKSAERGDCSSQKKLADCFRSGQGTKRSFAKAVFWYEKAAQQGDYESAKAAVYCYRIGGNDLSQDVKKAEEIAQKYGVDIDVEDGIDDIMRGAESGNPAMQFALANAYYNGTGISASTQMAVYWYKKSAAQGYAPAQYNLACCLSSGTGTNKDTNAAAQLYSQAAKQGDLDAMNNLASLYMKGEGVVKSEKKAAELWREAALGGHVKAQYNYGECCFNGKGTNRDYAEAVRWYKKAAEFFDPDAAYSLSWCYLNGTGVSTNIYQAKKYAKFSAQKMNLNAMKLLAYLYLAGLGCEMNHARAVDWLGKAAVRGDKESADMLVYCLKYGGPFLMKNESKARAAADKYSIDYELI